MDNKLEQKLKARIEDLLIYEHLTSTTALLNVKLAKNCAFYKCCALSGEKPEDGAEPYPLDT